MRRTNMIFKKDKVITTDYGVMDNIMKKLKTARTQYDLAESSPDFEGYFDHKKECMIALNDATVDLRSLSERIPEKYYKEIGKEIEKTRKYVENILM